MRVMPGVFCSISSRRASSSLRISPADSRVFQRKNVADDGLVPLVNAEDITEHATVLHGDISGKNARIQILEKQISGAAIVPVQPLAPDAALVLQQGAQTAGREVAQVQQFELKRGTHESRPAPTRV